LLSSVFLSTVLSIDAETEMFGVSDYIYINFEINFVVHSIEYFEYVLIPQKCVVSFLTTQ